MPPTILFTIRIKHRDSMRGKHLLAEDGMLAIETLAGTVGEETRRKADVVAVTSLMNVYN